MGRSHLSLLVTYLRIYSYLLVTVGCVAVTTARLLTRAARMMGSLVSLAYRHSGMRHMSRTLATPALRQEERSCSE